MLADPRQSCVVLLNVTRPSPAGVTETLALRRAKSLSLLAVCKELFAVPLLVLGDYDKAQFSDPIDGSVRRLDVETFARGEMRGLRTCWLALTPDASFWAVRSWKKRS